MGLKSINLVGFETATEQAINNIKATNRTSEFVWPIVWREGNPVWGDIRNSPLYRKQIEKARIANLAYMVVQDRKISLAFNSLHTLFTDRQWWEVKTINRAWKASTLVCPGGHPPVVIDYFLSGDSRDLHRDNEIVVLTWLVNQYQILADGLSNSTWRARAGRQADLTWAHLMRVIPAA